MRRRALAALISLVVRLWLRTLRLRRVGPPFVAPGIIAFWHGDQLPLLGIRPRGLVVAPVSLSRDGRLQAEVLRRLGVGEVPGSSSRGGMRALRGLLRQLQAGALVLMAVDGPRGPPRRAKPGVALLGRRTGLPIWPVAVAVRRGRRLRRAWDRFMLPCPFTRVVVVVGGPVRLGAEDGPAAVEAAILDAASRARALLGGDDATTPAA